MNKIVKIIENIILIIIIVLLGLYAVLRIANKVEIYKVETGSMEDGIHVGDYILILKNTNYKVGDVVTYVIDDYYVTHRIVREDGQKIITKGDANNVEDEEITKDIIVGKVIIKGGLLNIIVNYKLFLVCIFLSIYMFSYYIDSIKREKNKEKEKVEEKVKEEEKIKKEKK